MRLRKRFSFKRKPLAKETVFKNIMQTPQDPSSNLGGGTTTLKYPKTKYFLILMRVDCAICGYIIIDGTRYDHDVVVSGGRVSKRHGNSSVTRGEMQILMSGNPDAIVIDTGHSNICGVEPAGAVDAQVAGIEIIAKPTSAALDEFNKLSRRKKVAAIFHVV